MGPHQKYGVCPGRIPGQGSTAFDRTNATPWEGRKVDVPPPAGATKEAGIVRARTSALQRQNKVAQFIATRPIMGLCEVAERRKGTRVPQRWWEQPGIDWKLAREKGERAAATAEHAGAPAEETETLGSGKGTGEEASLGASGSSGEEWSGAED